MGLNQCGCVKFVHLTRPDEESFSLRFSDLAIMEEIRDGHLAVASTLFKTLIILDSDLKNVDMNATVYDLTEIVKIAKIAGHTAKIINI